MMNLDLNLGRVKATGARVRQDDRHLPSIIAGPVREEACIVAASAVGAGGDVANTERVRPVGQQRAEIDAGGPVGLPAGEMRIHVGAHFVARATDGGAEVQGEFIGGTAPA